MRVFRTAIVVAVVLVAFVLGRLTTASTPAAAAFMPQATTFSHFECYNAVLPKFSGAQVNLKDQFQSYTTGVGQPELFCTPVTKTVISGPNMHVPPPADHLTCYQIQGPNPNQTRTFYNQFQKGQVSVQSPALLCLPTHKVG
ncbi:MAG: hypothetical protein JO113_07500 [Candidatus Eremiobacteraeota bacterium]|nr:hypothetical protein [Candidatus Eremiobacteraeota bacterium]